MEKFNQSEDIMMPESFEPSSVVENKSDDVVNRKVSSEESKLSEPFSFDCEPNIQLYIDIFHLFWFVFLCSITKALLPTFRWGNPYPFI